jgi:predicted transcriptional regulator
MNKPPEDVSLEDVQQAVRRGIEAADRGELVDQEEIERRMRRWLDE